MKLRILFNCVLVLICLAEVGGIYVQHQETDRLHDEERQFLSRLAGPSASADTPPAEVRPVSSEASSGASADLLKLRSEVTRLTQRQRELAGVTAEGDRLRNQLDARATNAMPEGVPAGFLLKSRAQFAGYNSPEDTVQSVLWAIQNRDTTNLLRAFIPETAEKLARHFQEDQAAGRDIFDDGEDVSGIAIVGRDQHPDGSVTLSLQIGTNGRTESTLFRFVDGGWKVADPE
jgi:hypothetical protein